MIGLGGGQRAQLGRHQRAVDDLHQPLRQRQPAEEVSLDAVGDRDDAVRRRVEPALQRRHDDAPERSAAGQGAALGEDQAVAGPGEQRRQGGDDVGAARGREEDVRRPPPQQPGERPPGGPQRAGAERLHRHVGGHRGQQLPFRPHQHQGGTEAAAVEPREQRQGHPVGAALAQRRPQQVERARRRRGVRGRRGLSGLSHPRCARAAGRSGPRRPAGPAARGRRQVG